MLPKKSTLLTTAAIVAISALATAQTSRNGTGGKHIGDRDWAAVHVEAAVNTAATRTSATTSFRHTQGVDWLHRHRDVAVIQGQIRSNAINDVSVRIGSQTVFSNRVPSYVQTDFQPVVVEALSGSASANLGIFSARIQGSIVSSAGFVMTPRTRNGAPAAAHLSMITALDSFGANASLSVSVLGGLGTAWLESELRLLPSNLFVTCPTEQSMLNRSDCYLQIHDYAVKLKVKGRIGPSWSPVRGSVTLVDVAGGEERIPVLVPQ